MGPENHTMYMVAYLIDSIVILSQPIILDMKYR